MSTPQDQHRAQSSPPGSRPRLIVGIAGLALALCASLAAGGTTTVSSASNAKLARQIVVDAQGRTLYALRPETAHHLLCKSSACLKFWPPLTVRSSRTKLEAGPGVQGRLAILRRSDGALQITLGGLPLYRYSGDNAKGAANGQGIDSFGGTWHVLSAKGASSPAAPTTSTTPAAPTPPAAPTTPTPTAPSPTPGYGY